MLISYPGLPIFLILSSRAPVPQHTSAPPTVLTELGTLPTLDVVHVVAVLALIGRVRVVEGQTVSTCPQGSQTFVTGPVLVTADVMREEAREVVWACELVGLTQR